MKLIVETSDAWEPTEVARLLNNRGVKVLSTEVQYTAEKEYVPVPSTDDGQLREVLNQITLFYLEGMLQIMRGISSVFWKTMLWCGLAEVR